MWTRVYLILCLLTTAPAFGGMTYRFEIFSEADETVGGIVKTRGKVWVEGERSRVDFQRDEGEPFAFDVLIYDGREDGSIALNTRLKTHYEKVPYKAGGRPSPWPTKFDEVEVELSAHNRFEEVAGFSCRKYTLKIAFVNKTDYGSEVVELRVSEMHQIWTTTEIAAEEPPAEVNAKNIVSSPEVEREIAEKLLEIKGFPLRRQSSTTWQYVGGPPQDSDRSLRLFDFEQVEIPDAKFGIPVGYRYSEPQLLAPGRGR